MRQPTTTIHGKCLFCHKEVTFEVPLQGYIDWESGTSIQNAMPDVPPGDREFLISHICEECFDKTTKEDE